MHYRVSWHAPNPATEAEAPDPSIILSLGAGLGCNGIQFPPQRYCSSLKLMIGFLIGTIWTVLRYETGGSQWRGTTCAPVAGGNAAAARA